LRKINGIVPWKNKNDKILQNRKPINDKVYEIDEKSNISNSDAPEKELDQSLISKNNKNSVFRFTHYLDRNFTFEMNKLPIVSYINPNDDLTRNGVPDFSKITKRKDQILVKPSISPAICYYDPKYDYIKKSPVKSIIFSTSNSRNVKKNIKKILCSYDVPKKFLSVDVDSAQKREETLEDFLLGN